MAEPKLKPCDSYYCIFHCCSGNVCFVMRYAREMMSEYDRAEACILGTRWYREACAELKE